VHNDTITITSIREDITIVLDHATLAKGILLEGYLSHHAARYPNVTIVLKGRNSIQGLLNENHTCTNALRGYDIHLIIDGEEGSSLHVTGGHNSGLGRALLIDGPVTINADDVTLESWPGTPSVNEWSLLVNSVADCTNLTVNGNRLTIRRNDSSASVTGNVYIFPVVSVSSSLVVTGEDVKFLNGVFTNTRNDNAFIAETCRISESAAISGGLYMDGGIVDKDAVPFYADGSYARPIAVEVSKDGHTWKAVKGSPFVAKDDVRDLIQSYDYIRTGVTDPIPEPTPVPIPTPPATGDGAQPVMWLLLLVLTGAMLGLRRRNQAG